ncbi:CBS domain-containing protein [Ostreiculturibacter nitratireducens]|uniref:CBS domain-containing protein n=1 Tax=Ostreiculturibacter nitratireducens TaxID=3075226 RepID=UPI0031B624F4
MLVQQILNSKPAAEVVTVKPGSTIAEAAAVLSGRRIGAVVISADGKTVDGILSERDIVRELARSGSGCLIGLVDDLMTKHVVGCHTDDMADDVLTKMTEGRFRHMPVVKDGEMVGLISIGDVVKARLSELSMEKEALTGMIMGS